MMNKGTNNDNGKCDGNSNCNCNCNCKDEIQGSFDCAIHDETVNGFAQDDACFWVCGFGLKVRPRFAVSG